MFSTGSQNHQPPQPNSWYAHQLPKKIPKVKKTQVNKIMFTISFFKMLFILKYIYFIIIMYNNIHVVKYPIYNIGGCINNNISCKTGFKSDKVKLIFSTYKKILELNKKQNKIIINEFNIILFIFFNIKLYFWVYIYQKKLKNIIINHNKREPSWLLHKVQNLKINNNFKFEFTVIFWINKFVSK